MKTKLFFNLFILLLVAVSANAQSTDWGWDWKDTSKVPASRMEQHQKFLNNDYPYPAKPRSQWELGLAAGTSMIIGDVRSKVGYGGGISARKALSHVLSVRGSYFGSFNSGKPSGYGASIGQLEYKTMTHSGSIDLIASLNTLSYYRGNPKTNFYVLGGYTMLASQITIKTASGDRIFYAAGVPNSQAGLTATVAGNTINNRKGWSLMQGFSAGGGVAFKLSNRVNLGLENKTTFISPGYDLSDGFKAGNSNDFYNVTTARLNINMGSSAKRVQPLYWLNPNNYTYNELNKPSHMKFPKPVLDDADGDGVTDQFDLEPNTPAGAKVDSHGRALDTDGDGIPDFKDKEVLTSQKCFPVNNDGVGTCPEPACCKELRDEVSRIKDGIANGNGNGGTRTNDCTIGNLPSIQFKGNTKLSKDAQAMLATVAQKVNANPTCKVRVVGYGASTKKAQQNSWERVNAVIKYLVEKQGISESRLIFAYGQEGDNNMVDLQGTTDEGPNTVPAPHPNLKN